MDLKIQGKKGLWKRMLIFGVLNVVVVITIMIVTGGDALALIPFLLLYSCTMPFISLLFSKFFAKRAFRLEVLQNDLQYDEEIEWFRNTTYRLAAKAGMKKMPEVAIYNSDDKNAFATGHSKNSSLIAVSTALLYDMTPEAVEAVIAHEVAHIVNGDMVTQTLLQSFLNIIVSAIVLPITIFRWGALFVANRDSEWVYWIVWIAEWIITLILLFFAGLIVKKYSRQREFGADDLASRLTHPEKMISALQQLGGGATIAREHKKFAALQFNGQSRFMDLFSTHPSIERRIKYLEKEFSDK
ncbi:zinc metalloprotease HtpX [Sporosarcina highlanderae]|uniref:Zinc metalloprotease HtpX n=1 Tax=Sporosarcina highlanderae TaxID=3035916 RepID=A0ABT8JSK6_9BACL|nr:zinc metalloprotease HtpX [Sporosarcina highlanderae]MDN4608125.1 zinc metalloprotease HtpX [Sporosarcina highlanderae]